MEAVSPASTSPAASDSRKWLAGPWPLVIFIFVAALIFNTCHNDLPYYYEKDAPSKVRQVVSGERNFFHPLLMLNTADVFLTLSGAERTHQNAAVAGRCGIALFTALGIAAFTMLAWRMEGRAAAIAVGGLLITFPLLFELSHIFKEDPALVCGLAFAFLAMQMFWTRRTIYRAGWMGAAGAFAISGKYVGAAGLVLMVAILLLVSRDRSGINGKRWLAFIAGLLVTLSVVNYQLVANLSTFAFGFRTEMADLTRDDKIGDIPHVEKVKRTLGKSIPPAVWLGFGAFALHTLIRRRRDPVRWMLILYPVVFTVILAYSPRLFTRHFLPVLVFFNVCAGLGIAAVLKELLVWIPLSSRYREPVLAGLALTLTTIIWVRDYRKELFNYYTVFSNPTRETFIEEAIYPLPADAVIASDGRVFLVDRIGRPRKHLPVEQRVIVASRVANLESIEHLRQLGVTHVAVHGIDSRYLFRKDQRSALNEVGAGGEPKPRSEKKKARASHKFDPTLYDELAERAELIYSIRGKSSSYNTPALRLYKLPE